MKKTKNFSKGRKIVIFFSLTAMALLLAIVLIGIFYGRQRVLYPVGVLGISDDYPAKTLYRVNQEIYVPVKSIRKQSGSYGIFLIIMGHYRNPHIIWCLRAFRKREVS